MRINMDLALTSLNIEAGIDFNFNTRYMGNEINLRVVSDNDLFNVLHDDKTIGHIRIRDIEYTWYVADRDYTPSYLVDEVGNKIRAHLKVLAMAS
jgi:hypothetical protein